MFKKKNKPINTNADSKTKAVVFKSNPPEIKIAVGPSAPPIIPIAFESDIDSEKLSTKEE